MKLKLLSVLSASMMLAACGSGSDGSVTVPESAASIETTNAPKGPASYVIFGNLHDPDEAQSQANSALAVLKSRQEFLGANHMIAAETTSSENDAITIPPSCSTQPKFNIITGLKNSLGFLSMGGAPIIGTIGDIIGYGQDIYNVGQSGSGPSLCLTNTVAELNAQFNQIETQIKNINTVMNLNDNFILGDILQNAESDLSLAYNNYQNQVSSIIGTEDRPGIYDEFMSVTGILENPNTPLQDLVRNNPQMMMIAATEALINISEIDESIFDLSGAKYNRDSCQSAPNTCVNTMEATPFSINDFGSYNPSTLLELLSQSKTTLYAKIAAVSGSNKTADWNAQENIVPYYEDYNKFVASLFHKSLTTIFADYYILLTANQMNYLSAQQNQFQRDSQSSYSYYIPNIVYIPGAYYQPTFAASSSQEDVTSANNVNLTNFKSAQKYLNSFFAGLINQLYENIANYSITDFPVDDQLTPTQAAAWSQNPSGQITINSSLQANIENSIPYASIYAQSGKGFQPSNYARPTNSDDVVSNAPYFTMSNASSSIIYQSPLIKDINSCLSSYINSVNSGVTSSEYYDNYNSNCPAFFPDQTDSDGNPIKSFVTGVYGDNAQGIITPLYVDTSSSPSKYEMYGQMYGIQTACQDDDFVTYTPTTDYTIANQGTHYLTCRLWKNTPDFFAQNSGFSAHWQSQYAENTPEDINQNWTVWTSILPPQGSNGAPYFDGYYVTAASNNTPTGENLDMPSETSINTYFAGNSGTLPVPVSTGNNPQPIVNDYWMFAGNMDDNYNHNQSVNVHMLSTVIGIDGFYYPLVYQFYNINGGQTGFTVVQNNILNNVGFISNNSQVPITRSTRGVTPFSVVGASGSPGDIEDFSNEQFSYTTTSEFTKSAYAVINDTVFWLNGTGNYGNILWESNTMHTEYRPLSSVPSTCPYVDQLNAPCISSR